MPNNYKSKNFILILALVLACLLPGPAFSQQKKTSEGAPKKSEPIEITSDRMRSENKGEKIIFSGNVVGIWGDLEIKSDILEVYNSQGENKGTEQIVAIGSVEITRGTKRAKGDRAVYLDKSQKIILTGSPKAFAWEEKNMIEGKEMIFLLDKDRFLVNERVKMKFYPKEEKTERELAEDDSKPAQRQKTSSSVKKR